MDDLGRRLLELLGRARVAASCSRSSSGPSPIAPRRSTGLYASARGQALAEVLADVESDPDDLVRLRLIGALREVLGC